MSTVLKLEGMVVLFLLMLEMEVLGQLLVVLVVL